MNIFYTSSVNNGSSVISSEPRIETTVDPSPSPVKPQFNRITLGQLSSFESIHDLTVLQLKDILIQNFVSIKGCVEKNELINKVELLYRDQKKQQQQSNTTGRIIHFLFLFNSYYFFKLSFY